MCGPTEERRNEVMRLEVANVKCRPERLCGESACSTGAVCCQTMAGPVGIYEMQTVADGGQLYSRAVQRETPHITGMRVTLDGCDEEQAIEFRRERGTPGEWGQESGGWKMHWRKPPSVPFPVMGTLVVDFRRASGDGQPESTEAVPVKLGPSTTLSATLPIKCM